VYPNLSAVGFYFGEPIGTEPVRADEIAGSARNVNQRSPVHQIILSEMTRRLAEDMANSALIDGDTRHSNAARISPL